MLEDAVFALCFSGGVPGPVNQRELNNHLPGVMKQNRPHASDHTDQDREDDPLAGSDHVDVAQQFLKLVHADSQIKKHREGGRMAPEKPPVRTER